MADDTPILLGYSYLNTTLLPNIDLKIASTTSFTKIFEEYGLEPIRNHSEIEIIPSDEEYMQLLQIQNNLPLIKIASRSTDAKSGQIIEYVESYFRSDLVKISIDFNNQKEVTTL
jgi:DNA-binding GntR family transcriptional regulator